VDLGQPGRDGVATRVATGGPSRRLPVEAVRLSSTAPYSPSWGRTLSRVWVETAEFLRSSLSHGEESLVDSRRCQPPPTGPASQPVARAMGEFLASHSIIRG
jgi:hypothetical protein